MISDQLRRSGIAALAVFAAIMVATATPAAAASPGLNFSDDKTPNPTIVEDELTIHEHDRAQMGDPLEYYNDAGEVTTLNASVNSSQTTPVGLRFDKVNAEAFGQFPRIDAESDNWATWTSAANWTTTSGASSSVSVTDADADGVEKVGVDASVASTETATATFGQNVSLESDPNKRVLTFGGTVDELTTDATVEVRVVDGDGDYRYADINASRMASDETVIANGTGTSLVFQERVSNLPLVAGGDGTLDSIQQIDVVASEANAEVTISWLDADRKGEVDLADIERDTDDDGDLETTTVTNIYEGGVTNITSLSTLGDTFDTATIADLSVYNVSYALSDLTDESEFSVNFSSGDAYNYPEKLELYGDLSVKTAIDLSHGDLALEFDQGLINERYAVLEVGSGVDSSTGFGNASDSAMTGMTGALSGQDTTAELVSSATADTNYRFHAVILYQTEEVDTIQDTSAGMGPTGSGGGGFFGGIWGQITAVVAMVGGGLGLSRLFGGGGN
ncbi:hypothetical protein [Halosimplex pelagicum]|uniref:Uncharacterized protein n=1 Tax=Halosimplex pelagicum TaxID=869886 RepID=A0A7D5P865_9EURY|nr:hypothetical protein [Halosimplex pelagicum]QLH83226.1 hypothetical protein HZS54_17015 [Halosimplex pelagicum]